METWILRKRPVSLEKRFEFQNYEATRDFLDRLGEHSEASNRFPDISFGKTYVNITLRPENVDKEEALSEADHKFATEIDELFY